MDLNRTYYVYSPNASRLLAQESALPNQRWIQADITQIPDEVDFPIIEGNADFDRRPYAYLGYWHWDLRPALRGVGKLDNEERFCAKFLLSIEDGNHDLPELLAHFVHKLACKVRKRSEGNVELDDIAFTVSGPFICGYIQFKTTWLRSILEWTLSVSDLWLTDQYGPVYYQTNALIINAETLKAWHHLVDVACSELTTPA